VAMHRLPVIFCLDRAGVTGPDGASHHGVYDLALLSKVPGMRVLAPSSAQELQQMLLDAVGLADSGPVAIRYPRGAARQVDEHDVGAGLAARRVLAATVPATDAVCVLAIGKLVEAALKAAARFEQGPYAGRVEVWDVRSCAPLDPEMLAAAAGFRAVVTAEDGLRAGGIGMMIAEELRGSSITVLGLPTKFLPHGDAKQILANCGLDADGLADTIAAALG
jgi:1-deoxy-D-xylulose-5-phosphate synthase